MTGDRNSCCCSFLLKRFEKIFLSPEQTLGLSLPCWHCHLSGCDESSVGTFSRLCKKSVVLHFFVLVQDEASDLTVFLHLDLQILINSFLWHFRYFLTAVEKRGKKKKDRKKKKIKEAFSILYIFPGMVFIICRWLFLQFWLWMFTFFTHRANYPLTPYGREVYSFIHSDVWELSGNVFPTFWYGNISVRGGLICFEISTLVVFRS